MTALYQRAFEEGKGGTGKVYTSEREPQEFRNDQAAIVRQFEKDFKDELAGKEDAGHFRTSWPLEADFKDHEQVFKDDPTGLRTLLHKVFKPALAASDKHFQLEKPIVVALSNSQISPPIFNVYDALAVVHTLLAQRDETTTWPKGSEPPPVIQRYIDSLQRCCATFARGADGSKTKAGKKLGALPSVVGFSVPVLAIGIPGSRDGSISSADFGVSAAGDFHDKRMIAKTRLREFVKKPKHVDGINSVQVEKWLSGNCAEQMFWPRKGSLPGTKYYALAYSNRDADTVKWRTKKEACKNCQMLVDKVIWLRGFVIEDRYQPSSKEEQLAREKQYEETEKKAWEEILKKDSFSNPYGQCLT